MDKPNGNVSKLNANENGALLLYGEMVQYTVAEFDNIIYKISLMFIVQCFWILNSEWGNVSDL